MFKRPLIVFVFFLAVSSGVLAQNEATTADGAYVDVNGLHMYYEIHGEGEPLIVLHGGYMAIPTLGEIVPRLAESRQVIALELQGHGRTADIERPLSYDFMAEDIVAFMDTLGIQEADLFGFSMGSGIALNIAINFPERVDRLVLASPAYSREAYYPGFFDMLDMISPELFEGTPIISDYERLAPNPEDFPILVEKLIALEHETEDWSPEQIQSIAAPTLIIIGDSDSVRPEHAVDMFRLLGGGVDGDLMGIPNSRFAVLPATTHIGVIFRVDWLDSMINEFLDTPLSN